jgi:hypothetical protein
MFIIHTVATEATHININNVCSHVQGKISQWQK